MKKVFLFLFTCYSFLVTAQNNVGIGTNTPNASAKLDISSSNSGLLIPRMALSDVTVASPVTGPADGLMVWNTNAAIIGGAGIGFYYWDAGTWAKISTGNVIAATLTNGRIWIGNASNVPTERLLSGDVTMTNTGVTTIGVGKVTSGKILDGTIATVDIANNAVNGTKIQLTGNINGDLMTYNGTDWVVLAAGASGFVLTSNGPGTTPTYQDPNALVNSGSLTTATTGLTVTNGAGAVLGTGTAIDYDLPWGISVLAVGATGVSGGAGLANSYVGADGQIHQLPADSSAINIYNTDGTLTGPRVVTAAANPLSFTSTITNGFSVDGTTFSVDAANDKVGIGTTAPTAKLEVANDDAKINDVSIGRGAGYIITNTAIGNTALSSNTTGTFNTATGASALASNTTGVANVANGMNALASNTTGFNNISVGAASMGSNTTGFQNTVVGLNGLFFNTSGSDNSALGVNALINNTTGVGNTAVGRAALVANATGTDNTAIGSGADLASGNLTNATAIGANTIVNNSNSLVLGNGANVGIGTSAPATKLEVIGKTKTDSFQMTNGATANYILQSDAAGNGTWVSPDSIASATSVNIYNTDGTLTGPRIVTGAANPLSFTSTITNGFSVDGTTFSVDAANNNVGIGTTAPISPLSVTRGSSFVGIADLTNFGYDLGIKNTTTGGSPGINMLNNINNSFSIGVNGTTHFASPNNAFLWQAGPYGIRFGTNATERMFLNNLGDLGIGTSTPSAKLEVIGKTKTDSFQMTNGATANYILQSDAAGNGTWVSPDSIAPATSVNIYNANGTLTGPRVVTAGANTLAITSTAANGFSVDGTTFSINAANNRVGIGTAAPTSKLDVIGNTKTTNFQMTAGAVNNYILKSDASGNGAWISADSFLTNDNIYTTDGTLAGPRIVTGAANPLSFTSTITNGFSVDGTTLSVDAANDYVGIGTTTPAAKLDVTGGDALVNGLNVGRGAGANLNNSVLGFNTLTNNTSGIRNTAIGANALGANTTGNFNTAIGWNAQGSTTTGISNDAMGYMSLSSNTSGQYNVSIGDWSLRQNTIGIENSALGHGALYGNTTGNNNTGVGTGAFFNNSTGSNNTAIGHAADVSVDGLDNATAIGANTIVSQSNSVILGNNTNVGIGTSAPVTKLEVIGKTKTDSFQMTNGATANYILQSDAAGNGTWVSPDSIASATSVNIYNANGTLTGPRVVTAGANTLAITSTAANGFSVDGTTFSINAANNRVGIGTAAPTSKLDVIGNTKTTNFQMTAGAVNNYILKSDASGNGAWISADSFLTNDNIYTTDGTLAGPRIVTGAANPLSFTSTITNGFSVDGTTFSVDAANDYVGIGTTTPAAKLEVANADALVNDLTIGKGNNSILLNTAFGRGVLNANSVGSSNTGIGSHALLSNTSGSDNTGVGLDALLFNTTGGSNTVLGGSSLWNNTSGSGNTAIGRNVMVSNTTGTDNTAIGFGSGTGASNLTNATAIGANAIVNSSNSLVLGNAANVGIGTSAPTNKLEVVGNTKTTNFQMTSGAAANYILQSDAAGNGTWVSTDSIVASPSASTNIYNSNGSLTAARTVTQGALPLSFTSTATNGFSVDGSTFSVDAANNRIGIGTTSPAATLEISTANPLGLRHTNGLINVESQIFGSDAYFGANTANINFHLIAGGFDDMIIRGDNHRMGIGRNPTNQKLEVEGGGFFNGNLGVGVVSPSNALEVAGNSKTTNFQMTSGATANFILQSDATGNGTWINPNTLSSNNIYTINGALSGPRIVTGGANTLAFTSTVNNGFSIDGSTFSVDASKDNVGLGTTGPLAGRKLDVNHFQLTSNGIDQAAVYGFRNRDSQNDGTGYIIGTTNNAFTGYDFWGDLYTFGVHGATFGDFTRTGGTLGSVGFGFGSVAWGCLGYKSSASLFYGVYSDATLSSGSGFLPARNISGGIGGGFSGGIAGTWSRGTIIGSIATGNLIASYNIGNEITSGYQADIVPVGDERIAAYSVTSSELKVYGDGKGQLSSGVSRVNFDPAFAKLLGANPNVTVSPNGECDGLYIVSIDKTGFNIKEMKGGHSNVMFTWIAVGNRADQSTANEIPKDFSDKDFDKNVKEVMYSENNKEHSGKPMWWDGSKIKFDALPKELQTQPKQQK